MTESLTPGQLNWLDRQPRSNCYAIADREPYGVHGRRVFSVHVTRYAADREYAKRNRPSWPSAVIVQITQTEDAQP